MQTRGSCNRALAWLGGNGSVRCGGSPTLGGDCSQVQHHLRDVRDIVATLSSFAAVRDDGGLVTWGGDDPDSLSRHIPKELWEVQSVAATDMAFAALMKDSTVVCWGDRGEGGDCGAVEHLLRPEGSRRVMQIVGCESGFAAITSERQVVIWGNRGRWGDYVMDGVLPLSNVKEVKGVHDHHFAARTHTGSVCFFADRVFDWPQGGQGVVQLEASEHAFAALRSDMSVVVWGSQDYGGDCRKVQPWLTSVVKLAASPTAFAALRTDCTVVSWGGPPGPHRWVSLGLQFLSPCFS